MRHSDKYVAPSAVLLRYPSITGSMAMKNFRYGIQISLAAFGMIFQAASAKAQQEDCSSVLVKNIEERSIDQAAQYSYYKLVDTEEEFNEAKSGSVSGSYKLIEGSANYSEYMSKRNTYLSQSSLDISSAHSERYFSSVAADQSISVWRDCMAMRGKPLVVYAKNVRPDAITLIISYDPPPDVSDVELNRAEARGLQGNVIDLKDRLPRTWAGEQEDSLILDRNPNQDLRVIVSIGGNTDDLLVPSTPPEPRVPAIDVEYFESTGASARHPSARACVPEGYKLIGGGARVDYTKAGNLLTASYPEGRCWVASSKDHMVADHATVTAYAVGLRDPSGEWEVEMFAETGALAKHPSSSVSVPRNFTMTACGGRISWQGEGNLLTAIVPQSESSCEVRGKDHIKASPATATAYAVGIRPTNGARPPEVKLFTSEGQFDPHPEASVMTAGSYALTGGGARVNWSGEGNLLVSSYPVGRQWVASAKDHVKSSPATLSVFAIGIGY